MWCLTVVWEGCRLVVLAAVGPGKAVQVVADWAASVRVDWAAVAAEEGALERVGSVMVGWVVLGPAAVDWGVAGGLGWGVVVLVVAVGWAVAGGWAAVDLAAMAWEAVEMGLGWVAAV